MIRETTKVINVTIIVSDVYLPGEKPIGEEVEVWVDGKLVEGREATTKQCSVYELGKSREASYGVVIPVPF